MTKKLLFLSLISLCCLSVLSQEETKKYIYFPYSYLFCTNAGEFCISIPEKWGFQVPDFQKQNRSLTISRDGVFYKKSYSESNSRHQIFFISPTGQTPTMELLITSSFSDITDTNAIVSEMGTFNKVSEELPGKEKYQISTYNYNIVFSILTNDEKEIATCKEIIASAQTNYGDALEDIDLLKSAYINYYAGDSTYYPELGLTFLTPFNMSAEISATSYKINKATTLLTNNTPLAKIGATKMGSFKMPYLQMEYHFISKDYLAENNETIDDFLEDLFFYDHLSYNEICINTFSCTINGTAATGYAFGNYAPTIKLIIPAKDYYAIFSFSDLTKKRIAYADSLISTITIAENWRDVSAKSSLPTESLSNLLPSYTPIPPALTTPPQSKVAADKTLEFIVPEQNAKFYLPLLDGETYTFPPYNVIDYPKKDKQISITSSLTTSSPADIDNNGLTFASGDLLDADEYDFEDAENSEGVVSINKAETFQIEFSLLLKNSPLLKNNPEIASAEQIFYKIHGEAECANGAQIIKSESYLINNHKWYHLSITLSKYDDFQLDVFLTDFGEKIALIRTNYITKDQKSIENGKKTLKIIESLFYKAVF